MRYELADHEWIAIKPMLPNKPRGVPRVNDRRVLNGIFWVLRSGAPWRDLPEVYAKTYSNLGTDKLSAKTLSVNRPAILQRISVSETVQLRSAPCLPVENR